MLRCALLMAAFWIMTAAVHAQSLEFVVPDIRPASATAAGPGKAAAGRPDPDLMAGLEMKMMRSGEEGRLGCEELYERMTLIETHPDLGPCLVAIADRMIEQESDHVHDVLNAISLRKDIDPQAIRRYVALTEKILAQVGSSAELDRGQRSVLHGMNDVLVAFRMPESERLLIRMQQIGMGGLVAESLAQIGGAEALVALKQQVQEHEELLKNNPDNESVRYHARRIQGCMERLRARLAGAGGTPQ